MRVGESPTELWPCQDLSLIKRKVVSDHASGGLISGSTPALPSDPMSTSALPEPLPRPLALALLAAVVLGSPVQSMAQAIAPPVQSSRAGEKAPLLARDQTPELTFGELLARLELRSPRVAAARALAEAARARVPASRRPPDPQLQMGLMNYEVPRLAPMSAIGMMQLQVMQMVPVAGKLSLSGRIADARADGASARTLEARWEERARLAMAFFDLYQADRSLRVARDTKRLVEDIATTAQTMYAVGDGRQADVLRARVEIARMHEEIVRMMAMRTVMGARLGGVLDEELDTTRLSPALPDLPATLPVLESLVAEAQSKRPMLRAGEADLRAAFTAERLARREIWPDLQVGVQYGQRGGAMGTERMGSLMVGAAIPIFARDRQFQMRVEAGAMRAMAQSELAAMRADTRARVAELYADFMRARNLRALYQTAVLPQAEAAVTAALASYRVGAVNLMTLLDNQMTVNRYRQELFVLEAELGKALAELEMLVGRALSDAPAPRDQE